MEKVNMLAEEHWVAVPDFPNYEVSNFGRVCNVKRGADLSQRIDDAGFCNVALYHNGVRRDFGVHRLVARTFFTDFTDDIEVEHINGNREENTVRNLTLGKRFRIRVRIVETGKEFSSLTACAASLGGGSSEVARVINHPDEFPSYKGFHFEVLENA